MEGEWLDKILLLLSRAHWERIVYWTASGSSKKEKSTVAGYFT